MERFDFDAALRHHKAGDRRVDAARQQQQRTSCRADRHTAGTLVLSCVNICCRITDFDTDNNVGIAHIDAQTRQGGQNDAAAFVADLGRIEGEGLVRTLCLDLECFIRCKLRRNPCTERICDGFHALFDLQRTADTDKTEDLFDFFVCAVNVEGIGFRVDGDGRLGSADLARTVQVHAALDLTVQHGFKKLAVCAFEDDLTVFAKNNFVHDDVFLFLDIVLSAGRKMRISLCTVRRR